MNYSIGMYVYMSICSNAAATYTETSISLSGLLRVEIYDLNYSHMIIIIIQHCTCKSLNALIIIQNTVKIGLTCYELYL